MFKWWANLSLRWKTILLVLAIALPPVIGIAMRMYMRFNELQVQSAVGGLMNFVDAKQQGVIRFMGQNEKMATQLAALFEKSQPAVMEDYFKTIVKTDVFKMEDHPFNQEIKDGVRKIATWKTYHSIDYVKNGKIVLSSDRSRKGKAWTHDLDIKKGYSDVYKDGGKATLTFGSPVKGGMVYVNADALMLTNIVNGEIGNLESDMGAYYLAGVGKTFDYYIVDEKNTLITESRVLPDALLAKKGSEEPWKRTIEGKTNSDCKDGKYLTNAGITTGCQEAMGFYAGPNGARMLGASMPFYDSSWTIVVEQEADELLGPMIALRYEVWAVQALTVLAIIVLTFLFTTRMLKPITPLSQALHTLAERDLRVQELPVRGNDEIGQMSGAFNKMISMVQGLREMLGKVREASSEVVESSSEMVAASDQVVLATNQISSSVQQVSRGAAEQMANAEETANVMDQLRKAIEQIAQGAQSQAANVSQTSSTINQMAQAIDQVAQTAQEVSDAAARSLDTAEGGGTAIRETAESMGRIRETAMEAAAKVKELGDHSQQIGEIVQVISDIAEQTNLLALNAAIEAARAGEHGKGFAVVAEEVRKLAERSGQATKGITELIGNIQRGVEAAVVAMDAGTKEVISGTQLAGSVGEALENILQAMRQTNDYAQNISAAAEEVAASASEVVRAVDNVASITEDNTAATEEMAASSDQVAKSVKNVSVLSQDTAASAEEVGVSTQDVNNSAAEVSKSARSLAEMAQELREMVGGFKL